MPAGSPKYTVPPKVLGMSKSVMGEFERLVLDTSEFAKHVGDSMRSNPKEASRFIYECVESTSVLFQKWNLEILYLLALVETYRFTQIKDALTGISSRTLSLKLAELEAGGLITRTVREGRPLRVDYALTDDGRTLARLSVPMVMFVNLRLGLRAELEGNPARGP